VSRSAKAAAVIFVAGNVDILLISVGRSTLLRFFSACCRY